MKWSLLLPFVVIIGVLGDGFRGSNAHVPCASIFPPPPPPAPPSQRQHTAATSHGIRPYCAIIEVMVVMIATRQRDSKACTPTPAPLTSQQSFKQLPPSIFLISSTFCFPNFFHRSDCSSGSKGGDLGPFARGQVRTIQSANSKHWQE